MGFADVREREFTYEFRVEMNVVLDIRASGRSEAQAKLQSFMNDLRRNLCIEREVKAAEYVFSEGKVK